MKLESTLLSEEDVRSKLVMEWLAGHGFSHNDFSVEFGLEIQVGRKIYYPRSDVLVRSVDGRNLIVIEVKAPDEPINETTAQQGISYARLLKTGGIAPFTIITNGRITKIYDSLTGEIVSEGTIPLSHPHVKAGYRITCDDIQLRSEALECFVSLSPKNLVTFCKDQTSYRMRILKSNDILSGKKYIPQLYIERKDAKKQLASLLQDDKRVVILQGQPQVGKTNFVCHYVETLLDKGVACLFYPAVAMQGTLIEEICADFQWLLGENLSGYHFIHKKLNKILQKTNQKLVIFIDGWNETDLQTAKAIDLESEKLAEYNIQIVISMTNIAARRLLFDEAGNPSYLASAALIDASAIASIEVRPDKLSPDWSVVNIPRYSEDEIQYAYEVYCSVYKCLKPENHRHTNDPFLLRLASEQFKNNDLPLEFDEVSLIRQSIERKINRAVGVAKDTAPHLLTLLADEIFIADAPILEQIVLQRWNISYITGTPRGLFEAALVSRFHDQENIPFIDYYFGRERDFAISIWARRWNQIFAENLNSTEMSELLLATKTSAGIDALRWFFSQRENIEPLKRTIDTHEIRLSNDLHRTLLSCVCMQLVRLNVNENDTTWINRVIRAGINAKDSLTKIEAVRVFVIHRKVMTPHLEKDLDLPQTLTDKKGNIEEDLIIGLLSIEEDYPINNISAGSYILDAMNYLHQDFGDIAGEHSRVSALMKKLMNHQARSVRAAAAKVFGHITPVLYLSSLRDWIVKGMPDRNQYRPSKEHSGGIEEAISQLSEMYHGSICRGWLYGMQDHPEAIADEFDEMSKICWPIIQTYSKHECGESLISLLESLQPKTEFESIDMQAIIAHLRALKFQLRLTFDKTDILHNNNLLSKVG